MSLSPSSVSISACLPLSARLTRSQREQKREKQQDLLRLFPSQRKDSSSVGRALRRASPPKAGDSGLRETEPDSTPPPHPHPRRLLVTWGSLYSGGAGPRLQALAGPPCPQWMGLQAKGQPRRGWGINIRGEAGGDPQSPAVFGACAVMAEGSPLSHCALTIRVLNAALRESPDGSDLSLTVMRARAIVPLVPLS